MLNKQKLINDLENYFSENRQNSDSAARELADIIDSYIKSALVDSTGKVVIPSNTIPIVTNTGTGTNPSPITITNIKNKGKLK